MTTHAQMAAKLLSESAKFYRAVGQDNPQLRDNMESMASACETIAGLVETDPTGEANFGQPAEGGLSDEAIDKLIAERREARTRKDFQESDRIRDLLAKQGVILEDSGAGTTWRRG